MRNPKFMKDNGFAVYTAIYGGSKSINRVDLKILALRPNCTNIYQKMLTLKKVRSLLATIFAVISIHLKNNNNNKLSNFPYSVN